MVADALKDRVIPLFDVREILPIGILGEGGAPSSDRLPRESPFLTEPQTLIRCAFAKVDPQERLHRFYGHPGS